MAVRLGTLILHPQAFFLVVAYGFFLLLSYRGLRGEMGLCYRGALFVVTTLTLCGIVGGCAYGIPGTLRVWHASDATPVAAVVSFGSFGAYFGILLGCLLLGLALRTSGVAMMAATIPGMALGGAIARMACVFEGCCRTSLPYAWIGNTLLERTWPLYDIASLLVALFAGMRGSSHESEARFFQSRVGIFCLVYGLMRFLGEFIRDTPATANGLTAGQSMALILVILGVWVLAVGVVKSIYRRTSHA